MPFEITIRETFSAAHRLSDYAGACERIHGHNYTVEVSVTSAELDAAGMVMDFHELKEMVRDVLKTLDHQFINDLAAFQKVNPTAENIARFVFQELKKALPSGVFLKQVTVWETENSRATYNE